MSDRTLSRPSLPTINDANPEPVGLGGSLADVLRGRGRSHGGCVEDTADGPYRLTNGNGDEGNGTPGPRATYVFVLGEESGEPETSTH